MLHNLTMLNKSFVYTKDLLKLVENKRHYIANLLRYCKVFEDKRAGKGYATPIDYHNALLLVIGGMLIDFGLNLRHVDTILSGLNLIKFDKEREQLLDGYFLQVFRHNLEVDNITNDAVAIRLDRDGYILSGIPHKPMSMIIVFESKTEQQKSRGAYVCVLSELGSFVLEKGMLKTVEIKDDSQTKVRFGINDGAFLTIDISTLLEEIDKVFS